ncbi:methyltransferase domain-containing protein [Horticoccus luteus]|uniref:Methyltransferase domain-containing protein n=1 Tax=Horticoccus luteus TaxID=2862869 RepID=A0A8F9XMN2_9BACT|nr:protein-glutamate O-methyltransferase CheR [Horticoccus luteus]QYM80441.1 methyltransferase domain-containing protein [Horticoccus luteus]
MNVAAVETWLHAHAGLEASTLGAGVVARAARDRIEALHCRTAEDYVTLLERSPDERHALIEKVVVPETWFFRDRPALEAVARYVATDWGAARSEGVFRVLSVPCSTGEEPYSLAMVLAGAGWPVARTRIEAVDISRENLRRAEAGVYGRNSFRGDDVSFRDDFFSPAGRESWRVNERARAPVEFAQGNLLADDFGVGRGLYDAIFCRNLLIYFDRPTQARAIRTLEKMLAPGGWIAVGPAEPVLLFEHGFSALRVPGGFLLHRTPPAAAPQRAARGPMPRLVPARLPVTRIVPLKAAHPAPPPKAPAAPAKTENPLGELRRLADEGRLREARQCGEALVARGESSGELFYLLGIVADAAGEGTGAEAFYRKAVYLEPQHEDALVHLALLAEKRGDVRTARQFRERAQRARTREAV